MKLSKRAMSERETVLAMTIRGYCECTCGCNAICECEPFPTHAIGGTQNSTGKDTMSAHNSGGGISYGE